VNDYLVQTFVSPGVKQTRKLAGVNQALYGVPGEILIFVTVR
jgi:hypothetical protein